MTPHIVLYDGECGFCTRSVLFIYRRDPKARYRFASLQSDAGQHLLREHGLADAGLDTLVLLEDGRAFLRSTGALRIARGLRFPWSFLGRLGLVVPRPLRDAAYDAFARRRRRWFGTVDHCANPEPELRRRILG